MAQKANKLPIVKRPVFKKDTVSIRQFNAVGNGLVLNTKSIQAAIDQLASKGGGVVLVPPGIWQTGPIVLKSNINLHLSNGATLIFTKDFDQYPYPIRRLNGYDVGQNKY